MAQGGQLTSLKIDSGSGKVYADGNEVQVGGGASALPGPLLPAYQYEVETDNLTSAFTVAPSRRVKTSMNRAIKRLKAAGVWSKLIGFWRVNADLQSTCVNWRSPGKYDLTVVGAPTFTAYKGMFSGGVTQYLNTGIALNALAQNDVSCGFYSRTAGAMNNDIGATDVSGNGLTISAKGTSTNQMVGRAMSAAYTTFGPAVADWDGIGVHAISRLSSTNAQPYKGPANKGTVALASTAISATTPFVLLGVNSNGTVSNSTRSQSCWFVGKGLTDAHMTVLANVMQQLETEFAYGHYDIYEAGKAPGMVSVDLVVYGATSMGAIAAYEAKRQGLTVALVGGWRDRAIGGMSSGGLGYTDFDNQAALGGLPKWVMSRMQSLAGLGSTVWQFEPRRFDQVLRTLFDPRNTEGLDIPVYWSDGVSSVAKSSTAITALNTVDGRVFVGKQFIDCSYEGDLMAAAGASYYVGREAAGTGKEALNGFRGTISTDGGGNAQFGVSLAVAGPLYNIDPWTTAGDTTSGLLPWVQGINGVDTPPVGAADRRVQSYNFRITATNNPALRVPFPSTAPTGYDKTRYEPLLRFLAAKPTATLAELMKLSYVAGTSGNTGIFDINFDGGLSTDFNGQAWDYPEATYAQREVMWKAHENHIRGLIWLLQYDADARIPAAVRTSMLNIGLVNTHFCDPHPNDTFQWPHQLYVREARRLVSDMVLTGDDIAATDGTAPRSTKTISVGSYAMDSHHTSVLADEYLPGSWRIWNEGNMFSTAGGINQIAPLPYDIIAPKASEVTNLTVCFGISATHVAFGNIRMEFTAMQLAQSAAIAAKLAIAGVSSIQAVDYPALRAAIIASPTLVGEVTPVLPQVN